MSHLEIKNFFCGKVEGKDELLSFDVLVAMMYIWILNVIVIYLEINNVYTLSI